MITTFTLNPCIDRMLYIEGFKEGAVNRVSTVKTYAGGKGINVSKVLKLLGADTVTSGIIAGENGRFIENALKDLDFKTDFLDVAGETRINTKIYDTLKLATTDINEPGPTISQVYYEKLIEKVIMLSNYSNVIIFAGSIPPGIDMDIYHKLVEISRKNGCSVILDCDTESLKKGIQGKPTLIKPNIHELEILFSKKLSSFNEIGQAAHQLIEQGISYVAVSMGSKGVCLYSKNAAYFAEAVPVDVKGTVGAGDSMVAVFAHALDMGQLPETFLSLAVSASTACVNAGSTGDLDKASITRFVDQVIIKEL